MFYLLSIPIAYYWINCMRQVRGNKPPETFTLWCVLGLWGVLFAWLLMKTAYPKVQS